MLVAWQLQLDNMAVDRQRPGQSLDAISYRKLFGDASGLHGGVHSKYDDVYVGVIGWHALAWRCGQLGLACKPSCG